ncbi:small heat shock protein, chloroplastic-like [Musa acuminata AAA Group]|uniref:small heat shock protein, chloroplastic-like n=1 Tax=Musa acuminata AAA Group TaxID=214697 RepID=UPI0031D657EF
MKAMASQHTGSSGEPLQKPSKMNQTPMQRQTPASSLGGIWELFPLKWILQQMLETTDKFMHDPCYCNGITFLDLQSKETVDCCRSKQRWKIEEDDGGLHRLTFEMLGVTKEDVKVWVEARILYVEAKKKAEEKEDRRHTERQHDAKFTLPHDADAEKIKAEMKEGVLHVIIPKVSPSSKVLNIDVQ